MPEDAQRAMLGVEGLRMVMANLPVILFAFDAEGVCTFLEGKALESLGVDPERVKGRTLFGLFRDHHDSRGNLRRVLAGESFSSTVHIAGRIFEVHYAALRSGDGPVTGGIGVALKAAQRLVPAGAQVTLSGNADSFAYAQTQIVFYDRSRQPLATQVRQALGTGKLVLSRRPLDVVDVTVVIGKDFN